MGAQGDTVAGATTTSVCATCNTAIPGKAGAAAPAAVESKNAMPLTAPLAIRRMLQYPLCCDTGALIRQILGGV
jgi:hypothetical protein